MWAPSPPNGAIQTGCPSHRDSRQIQNGRHHSERKELILFLRARLVLWAEGNPPLGNKRKERIIEWRFRNSQVEVYFIYIS